MEIVLGYWSQMQDIQYTSVYHNEKSISSVYLGNMSVFVAGRSLPYSDVCVDITESAVPGLFYKTGLALSDTLVIMRNANQHTIMQLKSLCSFSLDFIDTNPKI